MTDISPQKRATAAERGLQRLIAGNERFVRGEAHFPTACKETLADMAKAQAPYATILGCSDSRVPPELIFDADLGELFIVRVAGNVVSREIMGSLQYARAHLQTPLFVVLGHEGCGAVKAALASKRQGVAHKRYIQMVLDTIVPGLPRLPAGLSDEERLSRSIEANVRWSMKQILDIPETQESIRKGNRLVGAVYEIATGHVRFL